MFVATIAAGGLVSMQADEAPTNGTAPATAPSFATESLRGRVVWLADALKRRYDIEVDRDVAQAMCALETEDGRLLPIVKDDRGRGFWLDERIRDIDLELLVRRFDDSPLIQVIRVYRVKPDGLYELDYWCDICAIPMFELKQCECCQGPIRIRERRADTGEE